MFFIKTFLFSFMVAMFSDASSFGYQMLIGDLTDSSGDPVRASFRVSIPPLPGSSGPAKNPPHAITENNYFDGSIRLFRVFKIRKDGKEGFLPVLIEATITNEKGPERIYFRIDSGEDLLLKHKDLRAKGYFLEIKDKASS